MRDPIPGTNVAVFILFFLMSTFEAFSRQNWVVAALWLVCGALFLRADLVRPSGRGRR
jgi:formate-dependent nitrite reductase membrane component NrfD